MLQLLSGFTRYLGYMTSRSLPLRLFRRTNSKKEFPQMAATSSIPIKETVYSGPAIETVYRGTPASSGQSQVSSHTVYDPSRQQTRSAGKSAPGQAMTPEVKRASIRFF